MPREPPVTNATLPSSLNMSTPRDSGLTTHDSRKEKGLERPKRGNVSDAGDLHFFRDAFAETGEDLARADLDRVGDAFDVHEANGLLPANGAVDLPNEKILHARGIRVG